jgi:hypothetical protein
MLEVAIRHVIDTAAARKPDQSPFLIWAEWSIQTTRHGHLLSIETIESRVVQRNPNILKLP